MTPIAPSKTAKVTRIYPPGSTLTGAGGRLIVEGSVVEEGAVLTHATPDGATGCLSFSARIVVEVRTVRAAPAEPLANPDGSAPPVTVTLARARAAVGVRTEGPTPAVEVKL